MSARSAFHLRPTTVWDQRVVNPDHRRPGSGSVTGGGGAGGGGGARWRGGVRSSAALSRSPAASRWPGDDMVVIQDYESNLKIIDQIIQRLDVQPVQV